MWLAAMLFVQFLLLTVVRAQTTPHVGTKREIVKVGCGNWNEGMSLAQTIECE
jgi:hypothetical protein